MKVRMKRTAAGPDGSFVVGTEYSVPRPMPRALADALVAAGVAVWTEAPKPEPVVVEAAVEEAPEAAVQERPKPRRGRKPRA